MANSKSNIYPVQLQGAELNLNKYDAEIKQYSGFNKNNAPFVGGCLSNIFTKDETIEGATSQNTYIAPNGDVYRVNTEGLWKNGEKIIDTAGKDFYGIEQMDLPDNVYYLFDEYCYITLEDTRFYLNYYSFRDEKWNKHLIYTANKVYIYQQSFSVKRYRNSWIDYVCVTLKYGSSFDGYIKFLVYAERSNRTDVQTYDSGNIWSKSFSNLSERNDVILKMSGNRDNFQARCAIFPNENGSGFYLFTINYSFENNNILIENASWRTDIVNGAYDRLYNNGVNFSSYYRVSEDLLHLVNVPASNSGYSGYCYTTIGYKLTLSASGGIEVDYNYLDGATELSSSGSDFRGPFSCNPVIKNYGACYAGSYAAHNNIGDHYKVVGMCDFITMTASIGNGGAKFNTGAVVNKRVLFNNELVSGLCTPSGNILLTEWNTVDDRYIYIKSHGENVYYKNDFEIIYKRTDGNFYRIYKTVPKLKTINNQIIINADVEFNAYNILTDETLLFAPAFNNRMAYFYLAGNYSYPTTLENHYYAAASVNEYEQSKNPSIILNPLPVFCVPWWEENAQGRVSDYSAYKNLDNVYWGNTASNVEYKFSHFGKYSSSTVYLEKYAGLAFPQDASGNVAYSPSLFAKEKGIYGNFEIISELKTAYKLMTYDNKAIMSYYLSTAVEGLQDFFTIQGQLYGILNNQIYNFSIVNEVANRGDFIVSVEGLQFVGNTPYEALFFSKTNRCLYSFSGANVLSAKQFVDKISEVRNYKYNPATQSIFLITDIGVIVYSLFGIYQIEFLNCQDMYLLNNGVILTDNEGTFKYVKYYKEETTEDYTKENIQLETMFYGMNNQTVTINDCLYMRIFSEEHEEGDLEVSATTLSLEGRMTEKTTFKIKERDWDKVTHTIYLRYQPKEQRGLGISFSINSPFKIASLSVGSQADAILVDKVSKGAINAPQRTSNNVEW